MKPDRPFTVYLSAAMRGRDADNAGLFAAWRAWCEHHGWAVLDPITIAKSMNETAMSDISIADHFAADCAAICTPVDAVIVLDDGIDLGGSLGVAAEIALARAIGVPVLYISEAVRLVSRRTNDWTGSAM